jgi:hypothetical protein
VTVSRLAEGEHSIAMDKYCEETERPFYVRLVIEGKERTLSNYTIHNNILLSSSNKECEVVIHEEEITDLKPVVIGKKRSYCLRSG